MFVLWGVGDRVEIHRPPTTRVDVVCKEPVPDCSFPQPLREVRMTTSSWLYPTKSVAYLRNRS